MTLGDAARITIGTADPAPVRAIFEQLGFTPLGGAGAGVMSDGTLTVELDAGHDPGSYTLTYLSAAGEARRLTSPDGLAIEVRREQAGGQPSGKSFRDISPDQFADPSAYPNKRAGVFGELCHAVKDLDAALEFWKPLGFTGTVHAAPYPWATLYDGKMSVGLHQTKDFTAPAITFFAPDMERRIASLRADGVSPIAPFTGTGAGPGNGVLTLPDGQTVFLFAL